MCNIDRIAERCIEQIADPESPIVYCAGQREWDQRLCRPFYKLFVNTAGEQFSEVVCSLLSLIHPRVNLVGSSCEARDRVFDGPYSRCKTVELGRLCLAQPLRDITPSARRDGRRGLVGTRFEYGQCRYETFDNFAGPFWDIYRAMQKHQIAAALVGLSNPYPGF